MSELRNNHPGSQADFYIAVENCLDSGIKEAVAFAAYKGIYTPSFFAQKYAQLDEARNMMNESQLRTAVTLARLSFDKKVEAGRANFQLLRGYINTAITDEAARKVNIEGAGGSYYEKAGRNWPDMTSLLNLSTTYITTNSAILLADNNMPAAFPAGYQAASDACFAAYKTWYGLTNVKSTGTTDKVVANNALYSSIKIMLADGRTIFAKDPKLKKEFTFSRVLKSVKGAGIAGLQGVILIMGTTQPIAGVTLTSDDGKYTATTDKKGRYHIKGMAAGSYTFQLHKEGYMAKNPQVSIAAGTTSRVNFTLDIQENNLKVA